MTSSDTTTSRTTRTAEEQLQEHLAAARWFGGKGRSFLVAGRRRHRLGTAGGALVAVELVEVRYDDGTAPDVYQLPLLYERGARPELADALVGRWHDDELGEVEAYDAVRDPRACSLWLEAFADAATTGGLRFARVPGTEVERGLAGRPMSAEQSNTSVVYGGRHLLKLFRRVTSGVNPDVEIGAALTRAGTRTAPALLGWVETGDEAAPLQLGTLQELVTGATDGWELALAAGGRGESFAPDARLLGAAVEELHQTLASTFPVERWAAGELAGLADAMAARLDAALPVVPALGEHAAGLRQLFGEVSRIDTPVTATRVHGDLHLGQTLRTADGWRIIDFEGEPAKSLEERRRPDAPWRDVAGMVRSFDYAAETVLRDGTEPGRARAWAQEAADAFLAGYGGAPAAGTSERVLLDAYVADKAVYEAVYEARNRPSWSPIPLAALARLSES